MGQIGRNDPCPCGSGRKYKRCCIGKTPRHPTLLIGHAKKFQGVTIDSEGQVWVQIESGIIQKADAVLSHTGYTKKDGKEKLLTSIPNKVALDIPLYLGTQYDRFYAIDTNTRQIKSDRISVATIYECYTRKINQQQLDLFYRNAGNLIFKNAPKGLEEKFSWKHSIDLLCSSKNYKTEMRIGIITDHDADNHSTFNSGTSPIIGRFYLPKNFTLLYARSDAGTENIMNWLLGKCEKNAKAILDALHKNGRVNIQNRVVSIDNIAATDLGEL
jgi:hypothetical protein